MERETSWNNGLSVVVLFNKFKYIHLVANFRFWMFFNLVNWEPNTMIQASVTDSPKYRAINVTYMRAGL